MLWGCFTPDVKAPAVGYRAIQVRTALKLQPNESQTAPHGGDMNDGTKVCLVQS